MYLCSMCLHVVTLVTRVMGDISFCTSVPVFMLLNFLEVAVHQVPAVFLPVIQAAQEWRSPSGGVVVCHTGR